MSSIYDFAAVAAFGILVGYFVFMTDRSPRLLQHFLLSSIAFAFANQIGNYAMKAGNPALHVLAAGLLAAGVGYAVIVARR